MVYKTYNWEAGGGGQMGEESGWERMNSWDGNQVQLKVPFNNYVTFVELIY